MLTRRLAWLTAADAQPERIAALLLAAAVAVVWKFPGLPPLLAVLLAATILVSAGVLLRRVWRWLLGPLFYYDILASGRRGRNIGLRCVYAVALLGAVFLVYASWFRSGAFNRPLPPGDLARFGESFFNTFMGVQFVAVLVLTPIFTAGAIADERERRRLDFLLVTELQDREIVCGKLAARVAAVALLLLTGLPVLALMQFLGGVEPLLLLTLFLATFITLVSVAAVGMGVSAACEKTSNAMWLTYLVILGYLAAGWCPPILNWGHPGVLAEHVEIALAADRLDVLAKCVALYAAAHAFIAVTAALGAMHGLRPAIDHGPLRRFAPAEVKLPALRPAPAPPPDPFGRQPPPPVGDRPLLWKELYVAQERSTPAARGLLFLLAAGITILVGFQCLVVVVDAWNSGEPLGAVLNPMVRAVSDLLACILLMGVAMSAVGTVAREREQQTLDSLLTLPVERVEILWAKWLGSILSVRRLMMLVGCVWLFGVATGAIHAVTVLPLTAALAAYATFAAGLGLVFSVISATKVQAMLRTMVTLLLVLVASVALDSRLALTTPPAVFWNLTFEPQFLDGYDRIYFRYDFRTESEDVTWALIGVAAYGLFAPFLWFWSRDAFVKEGAKA